MWFFSERGGFEESYCIEPKRRSTMSAPRTDGIKVLFCEERQFSWTAASRWIDGGKKPAFRN